MKVKPERPNDLEGPDLCITLENTDSIVVSWSLSNEVKSMIEKKFAIPLVELPFVLRLYDITDRIVQNDGQDHYVDFDINFNAKRWVLHGIEQGRAYCVEFGVQMPHGRFYPLKRSKSIAS